MDRNLKTCRRSESSTCAGARSWARTRLADLAARDKAARVLAVVPCSPQLVCAQIEAVFSELPPRAMKTGMLFSREIISAVVRCLEGRRVGLVVDPVMVATSGARLLKPDAMKILN